MGCASSKQQVTQVHPDANAKPPMAETKSEKQQQQQAADDMQPLVEKTTTSGASGDDQAMKPAASSKSLDKAVIPSIGGSQSSVAGEGKVKPVAFEIPLDDNIKTKARKPQSANPKRRLQPVSVSQEEIQRKLGEAQARWEEQGGNANTNGSQSDVWTEKEMDPEKLKQLIAEREARAAENRQREMEQKKAKLAQHNNDDVQRVNERKQQITDSGEIVVDGSLDKADPAMRMSVGGEADATAAVPTSLEA